MKFFLRLLSMLLVMLLCSGCNGADNSNADTAGNENSQSLEMEAVLLEIPEEAKRLTEEELKWFNEEFFNEEGALENRFLTSEYSSAKEIDLYALFYNGLMEKTELSEEEILEVRGQSQHEPDIFKTSTTQMNEVLEQYMGIGLEETSKTRLSEFVYLEEYDAYYHECGDTNWNICIMLDGYSTKDGKVTTLLYKNLYDEEMLVTLQKIEQEGETVYWFVSNLPYSE